MSTAFGGNDDAPIVRIVWREGLAVEALDVAAYAELVRAEWAVAVRTGLVSRELVDLDLTVDVERLLEGRTVYRTVPPAGRLRVEALDAVVCSRPEALRRQWAAWAVGGLARPVQVSTG